MDLVTQDSYEKRHKQSTIPPALANEKEIKEEPIQKIQPRNYRKNTEITAKNNNCGFCGQQNWSPSHKCPDKTAECNNCHKMGHFARVCRSKTNTNTRKQKINYLEETYTEEEESEPEEIQQITQINRVLPDENDNYGIKLKINGKYQNFTIDTGSPVTIMPNNPELYNQRDIKPLKERYQDVNKNEIQFLGKIWADIEHNGKTTKLPILITKRNDITPLLGVNWLKQLPIIINNFNSIGRTNQPIRNHLREIQQTIRNKPYNQKYRSENPNKARMLPHPAESQTDTVPFTKRRKKRTGPTNKIRTPRTIRNNRRRLFCITRCNYGKER